MMEHLSAEQLHAYLRGGLPAERLLTIDAHLASCDLCRNNLEINERLTAGISNLRADFRQVADAPLTHLTWEQLAALADQKLDPVEREMAESHLEICGACNTEFAELRQFADHLSTFPIAELSSQSHQSSLKKH
ncbi:MAG TPA: zf-HC2 domain-containing protein, partial [Blastocatellia bacterium]|nr:zf-HC2 domain-containing protein [Blastocatellia bacterium]